MTARRLTQQLNTVDRTDFDAIGREENKQESIMNLEKFYEKAEALRLLGIVITQDGEEKVKHLWDEECRSRSAIIWRKLRCGIF